MRPMFNGSRHTPHVLIGVQARSTSTRLPNKSLTDIGGRKLIDHVLEQCRDSMSYLTSNDRLNVEISLAVLVPSGDPLVEHLKKTAPDVYVVQGPEHDVLKRYEFAMERYPSDFIVRITGDCPFIRSEVISAHITKCIIGRGDYCFNCDDEFRTHPDGWDVEVVSRKLMRHLFFNAKEPSDREHVTTLLRSRPVAAAQYVAVIGDIDNSGIKLSIDTKEDLDRALSMIASVNAKKDGLRKKYPNLKIVRY